MTKFKVGDKVRVKSFEWYINEYKTTGKDFIFSTTMSELCGMAVTIKKILEADSGEVYVIEEEIVPHYWQDYMFEDEVVKEDNDIIKKIEVVEPFKIKKGDIFQCIKDVVMADGVIDYKKGSFYTSDCDGCITDEQYTEGHYWNGDDDPSEYFIKVDSINDFNDDKYNDNVNHPKHYTSHPSGVECIEITKHYDFCIGNAIKYLWRAGLKSEQGYSSDEKQIEDLKKAIWYIQEKIKMLETPIVTCNNIDELKEVLNEYEN